MNANNLALSQPIFGTLVGGIVGCASMIYLLSVRSSISDNNMHWAVIAVVFFSGIAAVGGAMIGLSARRIGQEVRSGGNLRPYLMVAAQYYGVGLLVLLARGNRDPLDLFVLPCLSAIAGVVVSSLVGARAQATPA